MGSRKRVTRAERVLNERLVNDSDFEVEDIPVHSISIMDNDSWAAIRFVRNASNMECPNYACAKWGIHAYPCGLKTYVGCTTYKDAVRTETIDKNFERKMRRLAYVGIYLGGVNIKERGARLDELCPDIVEVEIQVD